MQFSFLGLLIVVLVGAGIWWTQSYDITVIPQSNEPTLTDDTVRTEQEQETGSILDTIDAARETKEIIESHSGTSATIDLHGEGLTKVPSYVFERTNTEILNLSNNSLTGSLPGEIRHLQSLKVLDLSDNDFTGVPAEIGQLKNLETLNLSGNPITGLPLELGNLQNLKKLDLRRTQYSSYDLDSIKARLPKTTQVLVGE